MRDDRPGEVAVPTALAADPEHLLRTPGFWFCSWLRPRPF